MEEEYIIEDLIDLVEAVCDQRTAGYEATMTPRRVRSEEGILFLTVEVEDNEPGSTLPGTYWFDEDHMLMEVF